MNREILFKAKRKDNLKWVYSFLFYDRDKCWEKHIEDKYFIKSINNGIDYEVIPETICQYLGSINDIDLYENDIVKGFEDMYDNEVQGKVSLSLENGLQLHCEHNIYHFDYIYDFEVIGNIFDNPELLKRK